MRDRPTVGFPSKREFGDFKRAIAMRCAWCLPSKIGSIFDVSRFLPVSTASSASVTSFSRGLLPPHRPG